MKIEANRSLCDSNGFCVAEAPDFFDLDDNDQLQILREEFGEADRAQVEAAVRSCPKTALRIAD